MQTVLRFLYLLSIAFWIGSIFFFSLFAAPSIFKVLSREVAGEVISSIFPKYYLIAYVCGGVAVLSSILLRFWGENSSGMLYSTKIVILVVMLGFAVFAGTVIRPAAVEARSEMRNLTEDSQNYGEVEARFSRLHRQSVIINGTVFFLGIAIVFITAYNIRE